MEKGINLAVLLVTAVIVVAFFMPWVQVESQHVGTVSKILTGTRQAALGSISGFQVPMQANSSESKMAISVIQIFAPNVKDADKKSYLLFLAPLIAILIFLANYFLKDLKLLYLVFGVLAVLIFAVGAYKVLTTDMNKLILNVKVVSGLWTTLVGYLVIGILELIAFASSAKK